MSRHIEALRRAVSGVEQSKAKRKTAPAQFRQDFDVVAAHYRLMDTGEYETAWEAAMDDLENAMLTYAALAAEIRQQEAA